MWLFRKLFREMFIITSPYASFIEELSVTYRFNNQKLYRRVHFFSMLSEATVVFSLLILSFLEF